MDIVRLAAVLGAGVALTAACSTTSSVDPMGDGARSSVSSIAIEVSGVQQSDASNIGARGSREGVRRSTRQAPGATGTPAGLVLGLLIKGVAAAKGAVEAQPHQVVDDTRASLQTSMQDMDFGELLRARLAAPKAAGTVGVVAVTTAPSTAPVTDAAGKPVTQVVSLEYRLELQSPAEVNPSIALLAKVNARVQSPDRRQALHTTTWSYCGQRYDFVQMGANNGAALRQQIDRAAAVLSEAILYDLYVNKNPRKVTSGCMDFSDLPSRRQGAS